MATFVLVPGARGMAWYWHKAVPLIRAAGHEAIAVELPGNDRHAGLATYADIVISAIGDGIACGHLVALSNAEGLTERLIAYERG